MTTLRENPREWSPEARRFFGQDFIRAVDEGASIFAPYTCHQIERDPPLALELKRRSQPLEQRAIEVGTQAFLKYLFLISGDKIRAKKDPEAAIRKLDAMIASAYPEFVGSTCAENIFLLPIIAAIRSSALVRLVKWRHKNNKPGRFEYHLYQELGVKSDLESYQKLQRREPMFVRAYNSYFESLQIEKILNDIQIESQDDEKNVSVRERKVINDTVARIIDTHRQFGVPLAIGEKSDLGENKAHVQFDDINLHLPEYPHFIAQTVIHNDVGGQRMRRVPNLLEISRPRIVSDLFISTYTFSEDSAVFFIGRDNGEVSGMSINHTALKYFLGNGTYELLRTHLLLRLAELTCSGANLREALEGIIELPPLPTPIHRGPSTGTSLLRPAKLLPVRYFPRSALQQDSDGPEQDPEEPRFIRQHGVDYHPRLLPAGHYPSRRALALAADHDFTLRVVDMDGQLRYETFVSKHRRGRPDPILTPQNNTELAIQAETRTDFVAAVNRSIEEE